MLHSWRSNYWAFRLSVSLKQHRRLSPLAMTTMFTPMNLSSYYSLRCLRSFTRVLTIDLQVFLYHKGIFSSYHGSTTSSWRFYLQWIVARTQVALISWETTVSIAVIVVAYWCYYCCSDQQVDAMKLMTQHLIKVLHLHRNHLHRFSRSSDLQ